MTSHLRVHLAVALGALLAAPAGSLAQLVPGQGRDDYWEVERARLLSERMTAVAPVMEAWREALRTGDGEALAELYAEEAVLALDGALHRDPAAIAAALLDAVRPAAPLQTGLGDFTVGGRLVIILETVLVGAGAAQRGGTLLTTLELYRGTWRIRAQSFGRVPAADRPGGR